MAHFAKLDENNIVIDVYSVANDSLDSANEEASGIAFLTEWSNGHTNWKQTSYNRKIRKNYAGIGYSYDPALDAFIPPQTFASWTLDQDSCQWIPPKPRPVDGFWVWDEQLGDWINVEANA